MMLNKRPVRSRIIGSNFAFSLIALLALVSPSLSNGQILYSNTLSITGYKFCVNCMCWTPQASNCPAADTNSFVLYAPSNHFVESDGTLGGGASGALDTGTICRVAIWGSNNSVQAEIRGINGSTQDLASANVRALTNAGMTVLSQTLDGATNQAAFNQGWTVGVLSGMDTIVANVGSLTGLGTFSSAGGISGDQMLSAYEGPGGGTITGVGSPSSEVFGLGENSTPARNVSSSLIFPGLADVAFSSTPFVTVVASIHSDTTGAQSEIGNYVLWTSQILVVGFNILCYIVASKVALRFAGNFFKAGFSTQGDGASFLGISAGIIEQKWNVLVWVSSFATYVGYWLGFSLFYRSLTVSPVSIGHAIVSSCPNAAVVNVMAQVSSGLVRFILIDQYVLAVLACAACCVSTIVIAHALMFFVEAVRV